MGGNLSNTCFKILLMYCLTAWKLWQDAIVFPQVTFHFETCHVKIFPAML